MVGTGKFRRWRISIYKSSASSSPSSSPRSPPPAPDPDPPNEFLCPVSGSLMADPVVVSSGQTFERVSVKVCKDLGFLPTLPDGSVADFSAVIPNLALRKSISNWCQKFHVDIPAVPEYSVIEAAVRNLIPRQHPEDVSERELLKGVEDIPRKTFSHAKMELNAWINYSTSSSEESVIVNGILIPQLLPFTQMPVCYSSSSFSPSTSFEMTVAPSSSSNKEDD